jgi:hypothetical protein
MGFRHLVDHVGLKTTRVTSALPRAPQRFDALKKAGLLHHVADSQGLKFPKQG